MWGNLGLNVGNLVEAVQRISKDIEQTMDDAVGAATPTDSVPASPPGGRAGPDKGLIHREVAEIPSNIESSVEARDVETHAIGFDAISESKSPDFDGSASQIDPSVISVRNEVSVIDPEPRPSPPADPEPPRASSMQRQRQRKPGALPVRPAASGRPGDDVSPRAANDAKPNNTAITTGPVMPGLSSAGNSEAVNSPSIDGDALRRTAEPLIPEDAKSSPKDQTEPLLDIVSAEYDKAGSVSKFSDEDRQDSPVQRGPGAMCDSSEAFLKLEVEIADKDARIRLLETDLERWRVECSRLTEMLMNRERALESANTQMAELNSLLEEKTSSIERALEENSILSSRLASSTGSSSSVEAEMRKQVAKLSDEVREKTSRLESFEIEGQALAKKQGEMEKLIRKAKSDLREKDAELAKLKDGREQLVKTIEEMQEIIRKHDADSSNASKSISAMQAVSQASMERLAKLEAELTVKAEELGQQKRALDAAWTENADLKRVITDLRAQREDAKTNSDDVVRKMSDLEAQLRDIEQREAVLRATNKQLQEAVQRHTAESAMREDRLREEVADARKRWQDAISTRESMATEISQATGPLLRQISNLQESMKVKSESWQSIESSLLERAIRAESLAETAVYKTKALEEQNSVFQKHMDVANSNLRDKELLVQSLEINCDRLTRSEREQSTRVAELESRLSSESTQRLNAQSAMRELESRLKSEMRESKEALEVANKQNQLRVSMLMSEVEYLKDQLNTTKANSSLFGKSNEQNASTNSSKVSKISSGLLPNGDISFAAANQISQRVEQREIELRELAGQLSQLQIARDALLQEVSFMSARNAELEERLAALASTEMTLQRLETENGVLLALLGEKDEEVQALEADMQDVKGLYRDQLDRLYSRIEELSKNAAQDF